MTITDISLPRQAMQCFLLALWVNVLQMIMKVTNKMQLYRLIYYS
jgi:hypothetical protein